MSFILFEIELKINFASKYLNTIFKIALYSYLFFQNVKSRFLK